MPIRTGGEGGSKGTQGGFVCFGTVVFAWDLTCVLVSLTDLRATCKTAARFPDTRTDVKNVRVRLGLGLGLKAKGGLGLRCLWFCGVLRLSVCCEITEPSCGFCPSRYRIKNVNARRGAPVVVVFLVEERKLPVASVLSITPFCH